MSTAIFTLSRNPPTVSPERCFRSVIAATAPPVVYLGPNRVKNAGLRFTILSCYHAVKFIPAAFSPLIQLATAFPPRVTAARAVWTWDHPNCSIALSMASTYTSPSRPWLPVKGEMELSCPPDTAGAGAGAMLAMLSSASSSSLELEVESSVSIASGAM